LLTGVRDVVVGFRRFHLRKAWAENLLPALKAAEREETYADLVDLSQAITEADFNALLASFKAKVDLRCDTVC
jgi:hypothetical protein